VSAVYAVVRTTAAPASLLAGDEDAWKAAVAVSYGAAPWVTRFRAHWHADGLALRFDVRDEHPWHTMTRRDEHLWEEEVVEIFLDPDGAGRNYYELEINPANVVCDLVVRAPWPHLQSDPAWNLAGLQTRVLPFGAADAGSDGWTATAWLPWHGFRSLPAVAPLPPRAGDRWRFNAYRIKRPHGAARPLDDVVYAALSPTGGPSFHVPAVFRDFEFTGR
jgi:Carbohydrate family 9 binding domain-like